MDGYGGYSQEGLGKAAEEIRMSQINNLENRDVAKQRSHIYGLLAAFYRQEVTSDFLKQIKDPQFLGVFSALGLDLGQDLFLKSEESVLEEMSVEYARLFLGPGKHISPHESVHLPEEEGGTGQLWGEPAVKVKKFIEAAGLHYKSEYSGLPDHISVELEFMQHLTLREAQAWEEDGRKETEFYLKIEKAFMEEHLIRWIPIFCEKVMEETEMPFYKGMAALTKRFIEFEKKDMVEEEK
jgi:TorA maturation chaperone TorD